MHVGLKGMPAVIAGDVASFYLSLWLALTARYFEVPSASSFYTHAVPFSFLFSAWLLVFFIAGLYDRHTALFAQKLPDLILKTQALNVTIAALFFFAVPYFGITPKTILVLYLGISSALVFSWRVFLYPLLFMGDLRPAILIAPQGRERTEVEEEIRGNRRYGLSLAFVGSLDERTGDQLIQEFKDVDPVIILDRKGGSADDRVKLSRAFSHGDFVDLTDLYEDIFQRAPLSLLSEEEGARASGAIFSMRVFDTLKRAFDILVALVLGVLSLLVYPLVILAIKFDDGGPVFFVQERVGLGGKTIRIVKFRSMAVAGGERVTRVGRFLRRTRIDELPQLWNVLSGDLSLIGPRPELPSLVELYERNIPYYDIRHSVKPGLSGWAQVHHGRPPKFGVRYEETAEKLAYDLYYIWNRSLLLDVMISLRTLKILFSRSGI